jgi:hypothetical protein
MITHEQGEESTGARPEMTQGEHIWSSREMGERTA